MKIRKWNDRSVCINYHELSEKFWILGIYLSEDDWKEHLKLIRGHSNITFYQILICWLLFWQVWDFSNVKQKKSFTQMWHTSFLSHSNFDLYLKKSINHLTNRSFTCQSRSFIQKTSLQLFTLLNSNHQISFVQISLKEIQVKFKDAQFKNSSKTNSSIGTADYLLRPLKTAE